MYNNIYFRHINIIVIVIIIIIGSKAMCGLWPSFSSDFATNHFSMFGSEPYANPHESWRFDGFLSMFPP
jgi:hypothetical protein